jgi:hypothetical protein
MQLMPRSPFEASTFNPVFKPPAPDPHRDLPRFIRAGVVVPPVASSWMQENEHTATVDTVDSSRGVFEVTSMGSKILVGLIVVDVLLLTVCALCGTLLLQSWQHYPRESLLKKWMRMILKKPMLPKKVPLSHQREYEMVRSCFYFCFLKLVVVQISSP